MKIVRDGGGTTDLGITEATPTISIVDYSRRETDDFGVTTVVERSFARRMSVRCAMPTDSVDAVQRLLADIRATPAQWVADDRFAWLNFRGFYKDFDLDLAVPPLSYCTLTVEGLAATEPFDDPGDDPAPDGSLSTLRLLQPVEIDSAQLIASNVLQDDAPAWSAQTTYPLGARVIRAPLHRIYESAAANNVGHDPASGSGQWTDVGPMNRWAMFDRALGSVTSRAGSVVVTLAAGEIDAVALLDVKGTSVRVQAADYDRTMAPSAGGMALFLDLPLTDEQVTVTLMGPGTVEVGTLLIGNAVGLGITEAAPSAGITDYSRKEVDDFGEVTVVQRAWAKRMAAKALIDTEAVDMVASRIAAVRARPALWIGGSDFDTLTIYGFFKEFSIEVGQATSKLSLSIEGLSTAGKLEPLRAHVDWPDVGDPVGTKPADNADVTKDALPLAWQQVTGRMRTPVEVVDDLEDATGTIAEEMMRGATWRAESDQILYMADGTPVRTFVQAIGANVNGIQQFVAFLQEVNGQTGTSKFLFSARSDGTIVGIEGIAGGGFNQLSFAAERFLFVDTNGNNPIQALSYEGGDWVFNGNIAAKKITYESLVSKFGGDYNLITPNGGYQIMPGGVIIQWGRLRQTITDEASFSVIFPMPFPNNVMTVTGSAYISSASNLRDLWIQNLGTPSLQGATFYAQSSTKNDQLIQGIDWHAFGN
ncbi:hypothetical protein [uncultured Novosphingobium sp.]|uniref:gp53-like domain-containing protein n=1 Tax=uncultured Novosphingobium sp. TaxID=292277 RepID=UPI00374888F7